LIGCGKLNDDAAHWTDAVAKIAASIDREMIDVSPIHQSFVYLQFKKKKERLRQKLELLNAFPR
jgi:hypothetical protein